MLKKAAEKLHRLQAQGPFLIRFAVSITYGNTTGIVVQDVRFAKGYLVNIACQITVGVLAGTNRF